MTSGIVSQNTVVDQQQNCLEMASNFLFALSKEKKYTFQTFDDSKNKNRMLARILHGTLEEHFLELMQLNSAGAGIFVTVNETDFKGRVASNIIKVRACFVDLDGAPLEPVLEAPIQPHIVIESSPERYHAYWLIDDLPLDQFRNVQKALAAKFNSDPKVIDLPRVMRLVGFNHQKKEPFLSRIINQNFDPPIKADKFLSVFQINQSEERTQNENPILQAIREKDIFLGKTSKSGQWNIKCPWAHQHTTEGTEAHYLEPNTEYSGHGFICFHKHCENRRGKDLLEWLGVLEPDEWDNPTPLPEGLPPVAKFEKDMLPDVLGDWIWDIADRMQIPPDFSAVAAIVVIGSLIGRKIGILPKRFDDWLVIPNLFGAVVGRPSLLKSPAIAEVVKLLDRLIFDASKEYKAKLGTYELQEMVVKAKKEACQSKLKEAAKGKDSEKSMEKILSEYVEVEPASEPILKRYKSEDATTEKIGEILLQNSNGILIHRDELTGWLKSLDKDGREGDRAFYLEAWNGSGSFTIDRIKRGTLEIPALCLSIIGGIQPGPLSSYVYQTCNGGSGDDGLLQRFQLLVWPDAPKEWKNIDRYPDNAAKTRVYEIFKRNLFQEFEGISLKLIDLKKKKNSIVWLQI